MPPALFLAALLACGADPPPPAARPPQPPAASPDLVRTWRLAGRVDRASPGIGFEGARALLEGCPEQGACVVERWAPQPTGTGEAAAAPLEPLRLRITDRQVDSPQGRWRRSWRSLSGPLAFCLADPLGATPGGDPGAARLLTRRDDDTSFRWQVELSGQGPCGLDGSLWLVADADRVDASALTCDGHPWHQGGRDRALARIRSTVRATAQAGWDEADAEQRALWLDLLEEDPDAVELVEELRARPAP